MSLTDMQKPSYFGISTSLSDLAIGNSPSSSTTSAFDLSADNVLTIEELRAHIGSCFTCGVSWTDDHVSLDCSECGGYSSQRPCPLCDGECGEIWKRDFSMSHACNKARWIGRCLTHLSIADAHHLYTVLPPAVAAAVVQQQYQNATAAASAAADAAAAGNSYSKNGSSSSAVMHQPAAPNMCGASQFLAQDLCMRLERLSAATGAQT